MPRDTERWRSTGAPPAGAGTPVLPRYRQAERDRRRGSRGDELVPFADHVSVLVHDRVPHADMPHALGERAAVSHRTGVFDLLAGRADDVALGRLPFHPIIPLIRAHEFLRGIEHGGVVALSVEKGADPAGQIPVDELVAGVEHLALDMAWHAKPRRPGAITLLERLVGAFDTHLPNLGDGRRPHRLDHHFARRPQIDAFVEILPEGAELPGLLRIDHD